VRVGTGYLRTSAQRLGAFALMSMKRVCYEIKTYRADFLCELKQPLKRRIGLRYSNEFYFVTPRRLLDIPEIPVECGLIEIGVKPSEGPKIVEFGATYSGTSLKSTKPSARLLSRAVERNTRSHVAIRNAHAAQSKEGVPRAATKATVQQRLEFA
jgi:hypothetical protein